MSWLEKTPTGAELRVRRARRTGVRGPSLAVTATTSGRASGFARMDRAGDGIVLAWTEPGPPSRVRVARIALTF